MKLKRILLGASLVFLLTSCTLKLPSLPWGNKSSNGDSQTSQNGSGSSQDSQSQSGSSSYSSPDLPPDVNSYYAGINDSLTGTDLLNALNSLNTSKRARTIGYAGMRQFAAISDADPDGSGKIIGFYDNKKIGPSWDSGSTWNREHVWPDIRDGDKVENDAHMVRPAATSTNGNRGSKGFGADAYDPGEYVAYYRGAAARIIFYAAIADTSLKVVDYSFPYDGVGGGNHGYDDGTMGSLSEMLRWNLQYSPYDTSFTGADNLARRTELNRNDVIQKNSQGQGNRNPFIDHPEYACKIWGNTNSATKAACGIS